MKVRYDKSEDILTIQLGHKKIDDAYETDNMIVHVTKSREPVLLEIFDATKFLMDIKKTLPPKTKSLLSSQRSV
ncbi:MAG: hypothetical protein UY21_C0001G0125 [Microgenomates group bacterium GW2011_GWA1_48_10]|nr:MAG: hypothetical protein UY21_C0001G0125 [Microgenomates group bacterium GW2011_GWA1_48_10]